MNQAALIFVLLLYHLSDKLKLKNYIEVGAFIVLLQLFPLNELITSGCLCFIYFGNKLIKLG